MKRISLKGQTHTETHHNICWSSSSSTGEGSRRSTGIGSASRWKWSPWLWVIPRQLFLAAAIADNEITKIFYRKTIISMHES